MCPFEYNDMHATTLRPPQKPNGFALITALVMLLVITVLALGGARLALDSKRISRNQRDSSIAFQAAESALRDAERDIQGGLRAAKIFASGSKQGFATDGCSSGAAQTDTSWRGLCGTVDESNPVWNNVSWKDNGTNSQTVAYGDFTGQKFPTGSGVLPSQMPRYIIEVFDDKTPGQVADQAPGNSHPAVIYRITAVGWGPYGSTPIMLQSYYRKGDSDDPASP